MLSTSSLGAYWFRDSFATLPAKPGREVKRETMRVTGHEELGVFGRLDLPDTGESSASNPAMRANLD